MSLLDDWALALKKALEEKNLNVLLKLAGHAATFYNLTPIESISEQSFLSLPSVKGHLGSLAAAINFGCEDDVILPLGLLIQGWAYARGYSTTAPSESRPVSQPSIHHSWATVHRPQPFHYAPHTPDVFSSTSSPALRSEASYESTTSQSNDLIPRSYIDVSRQQESGPSDAGRNESLYDRFSRLEQDHKNLVAKYEALQAHVVAQQETTRVTHGKILDKLRYIYSFVGVLRGTQAPHPAQSMGSPTGYHYSPDGQPASYQSQPAQSMEGSLGGYHYTPDGQPASHQSQHAQSMEGSQTGYRYTLDGPPAPEASYPGPS